LNYANEETAQTTHYNLGSAQACLRRLPLNKARIIATIVMRRKDVWQLGDGWSILFGSQWLL
jgi:hypothetical protein